ncbi:DUF4446 family protein [Cohnella rhizosphaerae]|uniref:DUF4446 family protein n=1 Tax=Cohnella rhizosphaerae TaxID=1457232 RepID=A0A9X4KTX7_9BACL|nr:DUF4446 family protein [Cohnella rhizosphaerae]MDG0811026.1 DUF4446 family protein [Cohnella rhizosphaerae]
MGEDASLAALGGAGILIFILLIWVIILSVKLSRLARAHKRMIGESGVPNLEDVLMKVHGRMEAVQAKQAEQEATMADQEKRLAALKGRVGVHRFNAFSDQGGEISFAIAIVDERQDGVVLTGIHSREQTFFVREAAIRRRIELSLDPGGKIRDQSGSA